MQRSRGRRSTRIWRPMNECVMSGTLKLFRFVLVSTKRHLTKLVFDSFYYSFFKTISVLLEKSITIRFDWTLKFSFQLTVNWLFFLCFVLSDCLVFFHFSLSFSINNQTSWENFRLWWARCDYLFLVESGRKTPCRRLVLHSLRKRFLLVLFEYEQSSQWNKSHLLSIQLLENSIRWENSIRNDKSWQVD